MSTVTRCILAVQRGLWAMLVFLFLFSSAFGQYTLVCQKDGGAASLRLGWSVAKVGDVNGDCKADFIVGAPNYPSLTAPGKAYVYSGADCSVIYEKTGVNNGDAFGWSVAGAGDVNGDGTPDFIVGAIQDGTGNGKAYVYSGLNGNLLYEKTGAANQNRFGNSVDGVGDVNSDGKSEFIVGSPTTTPGTGGTGSAYVYNGADGSLLYQKNGSSFFNGADSLFGWAVAGAGDVNGDGKPDFIVGSRNSKVGGINRVGRAYVYSGASGAPLLYTNTGPSGNSLFGNSVDGAGDINFDGKADYIVGAHLADTGGLTDAGSAYVFSGANGTTVLFQKNGAAASDNFGYSVAGAGNVNGDLNIAYADFIIGAPLADPGGRTDAGSAYLYSGVTGSLLFQKDGAANTDNLGFSVNGAGDLNRDEHQEIIIGARQADPGGLSNAGSAFVYKDPCEHAVRGDMNGDGIGTPSDVVLMQNCVYSASGNCDLCFADTNCDGALTPSDVTNELNWVYSGIPIPCTSPCLP
ncbi:MAG: integrin alpha [candidate division Zixibacteria bacterium]|nr:integrin alpha [candidate division Zixibacteria bacterium]